MDVLIVIQWELNGSKKIYYFVIEGNQAKKNFRVQWTKPALAFRL